MESESASDLKCCKCASILESAEESFRCLTCAEDAERKYCVLCATEHNRQEHRIVDANGGQRVICEEHKLLCSQKFCESCKCRMCSMCLVKHSNHCISSLGNLCSSVKRKLHEMLDENDQDCKNLAKASKFLSDCLQEYSKSVSLKSKMDIRGFVYDAFDKALETCEEEVLACEQKIADSMNQIKRSGFPVNSELTDAEKKQLNVRSLLSLDGEPLLSEFEKKSSEGSIIRSNGPVKLCYPILQNPRDLIAYREELISDISQQVNKFLDKVGANFASNEVTLSNSKTLGMGVSLFRSAEDSGGMASSLKLFCAAEFLDDNHVNLELYSTDFKQKSVKLDFEDRRLFKLASGVQGITVQTSKTECLFYEDLEKDAVKIELPDQDRRVVGSLKQDDQVVLVLQDGSFHPPLYQKLPLKQVTPITGPEQSRGVSNKKSVATFTFSSSPSWETSHYQSSINMANTHLTTIQDPEYCTVITSGDSVLGGLPNLCFCQRKINRQIYIVKLVANQGNREVETMCSFCKVGNIDKVDKICYINSKRYGSCLLLCQFGEKSVARVVVNEQENLDITKYVNGNITFSEEVADMELFGDSCFFRLQSGIIIKCDNFVPTLTKLTATSLSLSWNT